MSDDEAARQTVSEDLDGFFMAMTFPVDLRVRHMSPINRGSVKMLERDTMKRHEREEVAQN